ncbi:adenylate kinase [Candidatus Sumerlaeota bacterium]|nr:adenylate kinase [Candidatus Sumerlaeota bacterium]
MNLILFGPPGSGKGTQAKYLEKRMNFRHLSTGDALREAIVNETSLGRKAKEYVEKGQLVPDSLIGSIVRAKLEEVDSGSAHFLFDGYPRNMEQVKQLGGIFSDLSLGDYRVISLEVSDEEVIRRLSGRVSCSQCGNGYNLNYKQPKRPGLCDKCGGALSRRSDDNPETIRERLKVYHLETKPLLDYFAKNGNLTRIQGESDEESVYQAIQKVMKG